MKTFLSFAVLLNLAMAAAAQAPAGKPAKTDNATSPLAAEGLRHSAMSILHVAPATPSRAERLVALCLFADKLMPNHPQTARLLADIYETQGRLKLASGAIQRYLAENQADHTQSVRWLHTSLETLNSAEQRVEFLKSVLARADLPAPLRAEAAMAWARILLGKGEKERAADLFAQALKLDKFNPLALSSRLASRKAPAPADRTDTMLATLHGNPLAVRIAWDLATQLDSLGLYTQSLEFFDYAWAVSSVRGEQNVSHDFIRGYFNAMLDAGQGRRAVEMFQPLAKRFEKSTDLRTLLIEAYRGLNEDDKADKHVEALSARYKPRRAASGASTSFAVELAWFYLITRPRPNTALAYARSAARTAGDNPIVQRVLGAAELATGQADLVEAGRKRLEKLLKKDIYAAAFLAEHYYATGNEAAGGGAIISGAKLTRSGPAFRRIAALAKKHKVAIPPAAGSQAVLAAVNQFDRRVLEMGRTPEKFLAVTIRPAVEETAPGQAIEIVATLTNRGPIAVPVGNWGLLSPVVSLKVTVSGESFTNLPLAVWPAPRYLQPGESVRCRTRLDVGRLAQYLADRPLDELEMTVSGLLDPLQKGDVFQSTLPTVAVQPAKIRRLSLPGKFDRTSPEAWRKSYQRSLGLIVRDMKTGPLPARMQAARQVASLLALAGRVKRAKAKLPEPLAKTFNRPVLLSMQRAVLADSSAAVRAEMLAGLQQVPIDQAIVQLLGPAIEDASPLVRFRLAELLGSSQMPGQNTVIDYLAQDSDPLVRRMAQAFRNR
ncbi:MAG: hypothetical protein SVT52_05885 [Planctomycetota bacterium]|nr:hypothetical protein [Planctomycetota bacterium]